jgi:hypothetical protein
MAKFYPKKEKRMKRTTVVLSILAMLGFANAQFQGGLTNEVPNMRVNAMGGIYSLIGNIELCGFSAETAHRSGRRVAGNEQIQQLGSRKVQPEQFPRPAHAYGVADICRTEYYDNCF